MKKHILCLVLLMLMGLGACKDKSPSIENPDGGSGSSKYLITAFDNSLQVRDSQYAFAIAVDSLSKSNIIFSGQKDNGSIKTSLTNMTLLYGSGVSCSIEISPTTNFPTSYILKSDNEGSIYQIKISDINLTTNKIKYQMYDLKKKVEVQTPGLLNMDAEASQIWRDIQTALYKNNYNARIATIDCQKLDILTTGALAFTCPVSRLFLETGIGALINMFSCDALKDRVKNGYGGDGNCSDWAKRNAPDADCVVESLIYAWDLDGGTPLPCCQRQGCKPTPPAHSTGDPHLMTFDKAGFDFQHVGEFIAVKATSDNLEIQTRQSEYNKSGAVSVNTGIAIQTGTDVVCVTVKPNKLYVNKQPQDLATLTTLLLKDGASIAKSKEKNVDVLNVRNKNGDLIKIVLQNSDYLDYFVYLADNRKGKVMGLLGNYDGNSTNDIQIRNGDNILKNGSLSFDLLFQYADSWRVSQANSLFYYDAGKNTDSYTDKTFPRTRETLTADQKAKAESTCRAAGVTTEPFLSNCIVDVAISNNPDMVNSSLWGQQENKFPPAKPIPVIIEEIEVKRIVCLLSSSFILKSDETLWVSGVNSDGQFGTGQPVTYSTNNKFVKIMDGVMDIAPSMNGSHMLFLKKDGVWAAGDNRYGEIGKGSAGNDKVLTAVKIMSDAKAIAIGWSSSYVLKNDGTLWSFGLNNAGQLGDGTKVSRYAPVKVMSDVKAVSAGLDNVLVLKTDNTLWGFGDNYFGAMGLSKDQLPFALSPTKVMDDVKTMTAGDRYSMVIKNNKELWVSGNNYAGQLGIGNYSDQSAFKKAMDNVLSTSTSYEWSLMVRGDNTLWVTGRNLTGSLGLNNTSISLSKFTQSMSDVKYAVTGYGGSFIVKTDNTIWTAGSNSSGQLGTGPAGGSLNFSKITVK